jgi:hypothetical protein
MFNNTDHNRLTLALQMQDRIWASFRKMPPQARIAFDTANARMFGNSQPREDRDEAAAVAMERARLNLRRRALGVA